MLQFGQIPHHFCAPLDRALATAGLKIGIAENGQIHAGAKMPALAGNHDNARAGIVINIMDVPRQLIPKFWDHGIKLFRPVELYMGDIIRNADIKALIGWCRIGIFWRAGH